MRGRREIISSDLQTQWQDHFHMRDQTWKVLQYSILFFLGVVGLEIELEDKNFLIPAYFAVLLTSVFGVIIALHHRRRQKEKFKIISIYEQQLGLQDLIAPVIEKSHSGISGRVNTSSYIVAMQVGIAIVSFFMLLRIILL